MTNKIATPRSLRANLKLWPVPTRFRPLVAVEVLGYAAMFAAFMNFALPTGGEWRLVHWVFAPLALALPLISNRLHGDSWRDSGCRVDTLWVSLRGVVVPLLAAVLLLVVVGAISDGYSMSSPRRFARNIFRYVLWGPVQQYLLCAFMLRRLLQAGLPERTAAVTAALIFGAIHGPNPVLVGLSSGLALMTCLLFLRYPNILALGLVHAVLALTVYYALPVEWHQRLTAGGIYRARMERKAEPVENVPRGLKLP